MALGILISLGRFESKVPTLIRKWNLLTTISAIQIFHHSENWVSTTSLQRLCLWTKGAFCQSFLLSHTRPITIGVPNLRGHKAFHLQENSGSCMTLRGNRTNGTWAHRSPGRGPGWTIWLIIHSNKIPKIYNRVVSLSLFPFTAHPYLKIYIGPFPSSSCSRWSDWWLVDWRVDTYSNIHEVVCGLGLVLCENNQWLICTPS